jgi:hypothetical protein
MILFLVIIFLSIFCIVSTNKLLSKKLISVTEELHLDIHLAHWDAFHRKNYKSMTFETRAKLGLTPRQYVDLRFSESNSVQQLACEWKELKFNAEYFGARKFILQRCYDRGCRMLLAQENRLIGDGGLMQPIRKIWHCRELWIIKEIQLHLKTNLELLVESELKKYADAIADVDKAGKELAVRRVTSASASTSVFSIMDQEASTLHGSIPVLSFNEVEDLLEMPELAPEKLIYDFDIFISTLSEINVDDFTS